MCSSTTTNEELECEVKTLKNEIDNFASSQTQQHEKMKILELQRTLNDKIRRLQSRRETQRVHATQKRLEKEQEEERRNKGSSSNVEQCLLCNQNMALSHWYDKRTYEYFTCCGKMICKQCHDRYVSCGESDPLSFELNVDIESTSKRKSFNHNDSESSLPQAARTSSHHELLLKQHKCPFCQENWSEDEFTDSTRLLKLAENGMSWAQVEIGSRFEHGMGIEPCEDLASKWYRLAADQNDANGQYHLGRLYKWGTIGEHDDKSKEIAKQYLLSSAQQGHPKAQHDYALMLVEECAKTIDSTSFQRPLHFYTLSLLNGYDEALCSIGNLYVMIGKMKDDKLERAFEFAKALYWLQKSAEKGLARGQMGYGMALLENAKNVYGSDLFDYTCSGYNVVPEVFYWLRKSSFNGELCAGTRLINCQNVHLKQCAYCHKVGDLRWKKCGRCCGVSYCSEKCQDMDWVTGHKLDCYEDPLCSIEQLPRCSIMNP